MSLRILFYFLIAVILCSVSCKKNDGSLSETGSQRSDCYNFPLPSGGSGYNYVGAPKNWGGAILTLLLLRGLWLKDHPSFRLKVPVCASPGNRLSDSLRTKSPLRYRLGPSGASRIKKKKIMSLNSDFPLVLT
jgi:hypothetical protein